MSCVPLVDDKRENISKPTESAICNLLRKQSSGAFWFLDSDGSLLYCIKLQPPGVLAELVVDISRHLVRRGAEQRPAPQRVHVRHAHPVVRHVLGPAAEGVADAAAGEEVGEVGHGERGQVGHQTWSHQYRRGYKVMSEYLLTSRLPAGNTSFSRLHCK